jgi:polyketide synthase 12
VALAGRGAAGVHGAGCRSRPTRGSPTTRLRDGPAAGTAFVELALKAGAEAGAEVLEELTLEAPLIVPADGAVQVQVALAEPDDQGRRAVAIHSRPAPTARRRVRRRVDPQRERVRRPAGGAVAGSRRAGVAAGGRRGARHRDLYDRLAEAGFVYGPAFQGLRAAWRVGEEIFAEVALGEQAAEHARRFGLHPALLDAALHGGFLGGETAARLPFAWTGVRLGATGASALRVRIAPAGEGAISLAAVDEGGAPVVSVASLVTRPVDPAKLAGAARRHDALFAVEWTRLDPSSPNGHRPRVAVLGADEELAAALGAERHVDLDALERAIEAGADAPALVVVDARPEDDGDLAAAARGSAARALELCRRWVGSEPLAGARLVFLTRGAVAAGAGEAPALAAAPVSGLVRSAHSEHPDRFSLVDLDASKASAGALVKALGVVADEPELALRDGEVRAPRLARAKAEAEPDGPWHVQAGHVGDARSVVARTERAGGSAARGRRGAGRPAGGGAELPRRADRAGDVPGEAPLGSEAAGVVIEVAPDVEDLAVGDRVMGLIPDAFGPVGVTDHRMLVRVPEGWSFVEAASVPVAFLTAYYALTDLAGLKAARGSWSTPRRAASGWRRRRSRSHLGAEVFATASPSKWETLRGLGIGSERISSSRTLEFADAFLAATGDDGARRGPQRAGGRLRRRVAAAAAARWAVRRDGQDRRPRPRAVGEAHPGRRVPALRHARGRARPDRGDAGRAGRAVRARRARERPPSTSFDAATRRPRSGS